MTMTAPEPIAASTHELPLRARPPLGFGARLIGSEEEALVLEVLRSRDLFRYYGHDKSHPPQMATTLEREMADRIGRRFALAVTSGTAALECALGALGIGPGDEVITTAWGWISCFSAIVRMGARPILAEIDPSFCLAPGEITRLSTPKTKAVLVVHYQGAAADMDALLAEADAAGIAVLEDCAQTPAATYKGRPVGSMGRIATFSFQYNKLLTCGEGGMILTDDPTLYERAVRMSDLGQVRPPHVAALGGETHEPAFCGSNFRLTELQAAVALAQLRKLDALVAHCRALKTRIVDGIANLPGVSPRPLADPAGEMPIEIYLSVPTPRWADDFRTRLDAVNVNSQKVTGSYCHYARPYCQTGYAHNPKASPFAEDAEWPASGYRAQDFPRTEALISRFVALPLGALYTLDDADYIAAAVRHVYREIAAGTGTA